MSWCCCGEKSKTRWHVVTDARDSTATTCILASCEWSFKWSLIWWSSSIHPLTHLIRISIRIRSWHRIKYAENMRSGGPTLRIRNAISGEMGSVRESSETANTKHSEERCGSNSFHDFDYIPFYKLSGRRG